MSSKKKPVTIMLDLELISKLDAEKLKERRSRGFIVEDILRKHFEMTEPLGEEDHANI
jgi:hypothetical protein